MRGDDPTTIEKELAVLTNLRGRDVITFQDWTREELDTALDLAFELKRLRAQGIPHPILRDKVLAMLFFFSSTRTRTSFEAGMAQILILPLWIRFIAAVTAGIVEDALFLGYAYNRLTLLTGSYWLAGLITVLVVSFLHFPHWGVGPMLAYFVAVGLGTAFFAWRRDLLANIVAHVTVDVMGLVIVPWLSQAG